MINCKFADIPVEISHRYDYVKKLTKNYITDDEPILRISLSEKELAEEIERDPSFSPAVHESSAIYRKLCQKLILHDIFVFHSSAVMYENMAYIFTAPSGTGKSTHASLWKEYFGDKAIIINDDKPLIKKADDGFWVYGTPWSGKTNTNVNTKVKIQSICLLQQAKENIIFPLTYEKALIPLLNQTLHFEDEKKENRILDLLDLLLTTVPIYKLGCNISKEAVELAYNTMKGTNK